VTADSPISPTPPCSAAPQAAHSVAARAATHEPVVRLTHDPLDASTLRSSLATDAAGAIVTFDGIVRAEVNERGAALHQLEYTAHDSMALRELAAIACESQAMPGVIHVAVAHRLGRLAVGDSSVLIVVASAHRAQGFDACRFVIEQIKIRVPIFKREIWQTGEPTWVSGIDQ